MFLRVFILTIFLCINAYAKPIDQLTSNENKNLQPKNIAKYSEDDLKNLLISHAWQIKKVTKQPEFEFNTNHWIFNFQSDEKYRAFGICNYLKGSYEASNNGGFRISKLDSSNNHCDNAKDDEAKVFNMLIMADSFAIDRETLLLKNNGQVLIELEASDKDAKPEMEKRNHNSKEISQRSSIRPHEPIDKKSKIKKSALRNSEKVLQKNIKRHPSPNKKVPK